MVKFVASEQTCPCPPACDEKTYPAATSSALWVAEKYKVRLQAGNLKIRYYFQATAASLYDMSEKALRFDLLKINVFYSSLMEKTVTDKKDYDMRVCFYSCKNLTIDPGWQFLLGAWRKSFPLAGNIFLRPLRAGLNLKQNVDTFLLFRLNFCWNSFEIFSTKWEQRR